MHREEAKKLTELQAQARDSAFYTAAIEKENQFLRLEIEKTKYSNDKEQYSRFMSGLTKTKSASKLNTLEETVEKSEQKPKKHVTIEETPAADHMKSTRRSLDLSRKSIDLSETRSRETDALKSRENQENEVPEEDRRKTEYNQRLLKSLERKTLRESVSALSQPLLSKYR